MKTPEFDADGYPTEKTLRAIRKWPGSMESLFEFVRAAWHYPKPYQWRRGRKVGLSTGGWSGNEDLILAMQRHKLLWMLCWVSSRRGGHYEFELPVE